MGRVPMNATTTKDLREIGKKRDHDLSKKQPEGYKGKPKKDVDGSKGVSGHGSGWF